MAQQEKSDSEKQLVQGTRRRSVLRAGLAVPLGSTAWLAACGGGGNDPFTPIAAMAAAPDPSPASTPVATQTEPVESSPPYPAEAEEQEVQPNLKRVRVLNLETSTSSPPNNQRLATEDIQTYTQRALQAKFEILRDALTEGLPKQSSPADLCYFVAPEFFWNVNWDAMRNQDDIRIFSETCMVEVQKHVRALIDLFPQELHGRLTLLPGSLQVLKRQQAGTVPDPMSTPVSTWLRNGRKFSDFPIYEATNYVLVIDNFSKADAGAARPLATWPKQSISRRDFPSVSDASADVVDSWFTRLNSVLGIVVRKKSTATGRSDAHGTQHQGFDNEPEDGVAFGIDIGGDYDTAYSSTDYLRASQIKQPDYVINFLISRGTSATFDVSTHGFAPTVQYVVRNDGSAALICEVLLLAAPKIVNGIPTRSHKLRIRQTRVATLRRPSSVLFDSYFNVHPAGQYLEMIESMPSALTPPSA